VVKGIAADGDDGEVEIGALKAREPGGEGALVAFAAARGQLEIVAVAFDKEEALDRASWAHRDGSTLWHVCGEVKLAGACRPATRCRSGAGPMAS